SATMPPRHQGRKVYPAPDTSAHRLPRLDQHGAGPGGDQLLGGGEARRRRLPDGRGGLLGDHGQGGGRGGGGSARQRGGGRSRSRARPPASAGTAGRGRGGARPRARGSGPRS